MFGYNKIIDNNDVNIIITSVITGILCGGLAILFRETLELIINFSFNSDYYNLSNSAKKLSFIQIIIVTSTGGLLVGLIGYLFMPVNRSQGMTEVIETALEKDYKISLRTTIGSFFINVITLGTGGATGRAGPIVHLASGVSSLIFDKLKIQGRDRKILLGCAAASAVSSTFSAPIAGVFFASELITGSYAASQFLPVVLASISGAFLSNIFYGSNTAFTIVDYQELSMYELPFFILLGILIAFLINLFIYGINTVYNFAREKKIPVFLCPAIGGLCVGIIACFLPQIMGDGYFTTNQSLAGNLPFYLLIMLIIAKLLATILTIGFGGGGGVFSPSLFIGAMIGGAFGAIVVNIMFYFNISSNVSYVMYSVAGMGAFTGGLLGAPISTVFMIFELTNNYILTLAVMISTFTTIRTMQNINVPTFFNWQLKNRGINLGGSIENIAMRNILVKDIMRYDFTSVNKDESLSIVRDKLRQKKLGDIFVTDDENLLLGDICVYSMADKAFNTDDDINSRAIDVADLNTIRVNLIDNLEQILPIYRENSKSVVAVVDDKGKLVGILNQNDVLIAYKNIIIDTRRSERL
ncbi:MAG: chloride channel protein [Alphaproteobacteria bacterium]|nr:chloride channel protein [Alphaproteobacteria bacterium]